MRPTAWTTTLAIAATALVVAACKSQGAESSRAIFERRILPLMRTADPSSCAECHLGSVALKDYLAPTEEKTFQSLRDQGLIDLGKPDDSKILKLIRMAPPKSTLVAQKVRDQELSAFQEWVTAVASNPRFKSLPALPAAKTASPAAPVAVIRHGRIDRVLERFEATVWAQEQRCAACHASGSEQNRKLAAENGERVTWIVPNDARATLTRMIEKGYLNPTAPEKSLFILKPTMQVPHGGGIKMVIGDAGYRAFRSFAEDYAAITRGTYRSAAELPPASAERFISTEFWLKLDRTPPSWGDKLLGVDLYAVDASGKAVGPRVATSDRVVFGKGRLWQHNLDAIVPAKASGAVTDLARGRFRARIYVDKTGEVVKDWKKELRTPANVAGEVDVPAGWSPGYGPMKIINVERLGS